MAQFASTLYPQTNPTNPILLNFRAIEDIRHNPERAGRWAIWLKSPGVTVGAHASRAHQVHAARVLERLASFTG